MENNAIQHPNAFSAKLSRFMPTSLDAAVLNDLIRNQRRISARWEIASTSETAYVIHEGWACAYKMLSDGSRQIIDFRLPGDFVGLINMLVRRSAYNFETLTDVVVSEINKNSLVAALHKSMGFSEGLLWSLSRDAAIMAEHIVCIGRRHALSRTAHLLLELGCRLNGFGAAPPSSYECPLTQKDLAEALGMTNVHLNRVLRTLHQEGLANFKGGTVVLQNISALTRIADFDPSYLNYRNDVT